MGTPRGAKAKVAGPEDRANDRDGPDAASGVSSLESIVSSRKAGSGDVNQMGKKDEPMNRSAAIIVLAFLSCAKGEEANRLFSGGLLPVTTGWEDEQSKLSSTYCKKCHEQVHTEWAAGMHARAWVDPVFVEAIKIEPRQWCVHCHAPLETQLQEYRVLRSHAQSNASSGLLAEGINCAGCHVRQGNILATRDTGRATHPVRVTEHLKKAEFCAECHQFNFPIFQKEIPHYTKEVMQGTFQEWRDGGYERNCQTCHYEGHRLIGPHDHEW